MVYPTLLYDVLKMATWHDVRTSSFDVCTANIECEHKANAACSMSDCSI